MPKAIVPKIPTWFLPAQQRKKEKHLVPCLAQCRHHTPFVVSTDGRHVEAQSDLQNLFAGFAKKMGNS